MCVCACCFASPLDRDREATRDRATHSSDCARAAAIWAVVVAVVVVVACVVAACVCVRVCVCVARSIAAIAVDQQRCARWRWWWRWWWWRNWSHRLVRRSAAERRPRGARDAKRSRAWTCQNVCCHCATQVAQAQRGRSHCMLYVSLTVVGFEPTRGIGALSQRLRPLGQIVIPDCVRLCSNPLDAQPRVAARRARVQLHICELGSYNCAPLCVVLRACERNGSSRRSTCARVLPRPPTTRAHDPAARRPLCAGFADASASSPWPRLARVPLGMCDRVIICSPLRAAAFFPSYLGMRTRAGSPANRPSSFVVTTLFRWLLRRARV